ncbi:MAG: hypothetical protein ACRC7O_11225 [Fimbriiglobus sp.]
MPATHTPPAEVCRELLDAIVAFPTSREVSHCGASFQVDPFAIYATCPTCAARIKVRSFATVPELEDVFDAVFEWMSHPEAAEAARHRQAELAAEEE